MKPEAKTITIASKSAYILLLVTRELIPVLAQSIGYHPNLNLGFNPYLSQTFGYGLGLPYGAFGMSYMMNPWSLALGVGQTGSLVSKLHAKKVAKKLSSSMYSPHGDLKDKFALNKYPDSSIIPNSFDYGYGKHYGAAQVPNNPYKSAYGDYYQGGSKYFMTSDLAQMDTLDYPVVSKSYKFIKPLIKVGALIGTAALLNKKFMSIPSKLDPAGMILSAKQVLNKE